jgi:uncharacterized membrane protein YfcA
LDNDGKGVIDLKERLAKLIDIKSIVTLVTTGVFAYLAGVGRVSEEQFITIFMMIIAFYFGTQSQKKSEDQVKR